MKQFIRHTRGAALIEFALVLPFLLLLLAGTVELSRFAIIEMKLDKAANAMSDFVTQGDSISRTDLTNFANTMPQIMKPFTFNGSVVFSSLTTTARKRVRRGGGGGGGGCSGTNCIVWQYRAVGTDASQIGGVGSNATLPSGYKLKKNRDLITAEVYFNYTPLLPVTSGLISSLMPRKLYKLSISIPRQGALTTLQ